MESPSGASEENERRTGAPPPPADARSSAHWLHGLDPLRAAMAFAVVAWHAHLPGTSAIFDRRAFRGHQPDLGDVVNFQVLCLAVPVFFLVSFFLYARRAAERPGALGRRIGYIASLYAFWVGLSVLAQGGLPYVKQILAYDVEEWTRFVATGGRTPFYFFFVLGLLTLGAEAARRCSPRTVRGLFAASLALLAAQQAVALAIPGAGYATAYSNPANFLPYVFLGVALAQAAPGLRAPSVRGIWLWGAGALWVGAGVLEWKLLPSGRHLAFNESAFPPYTRVSVVAGASLLFLAALRVRRPAPAWVRKLSDYSMGTYCVHPFLMTLLVLYMAPLRGWQARTIFFLGVYLGSLVGVALLRRVLSHRLV